MLKKCFIGLCLQYLFTQYITEYNRGYTLLNTSFVLKTVLICRLKIRAILTRNHRVAYIEITPLYCQCCFGRLCLLWGMILACKAESWQPKPAWSDVFPIYYKGLDRESNERFLFLKNNNNEWMNWVNTFRCNLAAFVSRVKKTATSRNVRGNF